jgi:photosystem II stability/assembly factor-like uncharacterized protein
MSIDLRPSADPARLDFIITYAGDAGNQVRNYSLLAVDPARGELLIDENNSIKLRARLLDNTLLSHFLVGDSRIATSYRLLDPGTPAERIEAELVTTIDDQATTTGGTDPAPIVSTWLPVGIQRASLTRVQPATPTTPAATSAASPDTAPAWTKLNTPAFRGKQDDIHFINPRVGWYCNGQGKLYHTTDAGDTWTLQTEMPGTFFRCLAFLNETTGFIGNIGPGYFPGVTDTTALYKTTDAGKTLTPVTINGDPVTGLCALEVVKVPFINAGVLDHKALIVGGGRVGSPAVFIKSTDLGQTFSATSLDGIAAMILDVHFFDETHGIIAAASDANVELSNALILLTDDAGKTWKPVYRSTRPFELTWKISFPTRTTGFVTIQSYNPDTAASERFIAKTTDGGKTWAELPLVNDHKVRTFGVAFANENLGWVGATPGGYETRDGGATWTPAPLGNATNKIRIIRENPADKHFSAFAIGVDVRRLVVPPAP